MNQSAVEVFTNGSKRSFGNHHKNDHTEKTRHTLYEQEPHHHEHIVPEVFRSRRHQPSQKLWEQQGGNHGYNKEHESQSPKALVRTNIGEDFSELTKVAHLKRFALFICLWVRFRSSFTHTGEVTAYDLPLPPKILPNGGSRKHQTLPRQRS